MQRPDLETRVDRLDELVDKLIAYGKRSRFGRALLRELGLLE